MRLIDGDKLIETINDIWDGYMTSEQFSPDRFEALVDDTPTVNAIVIPEGATNLDILNLFFDVEVIDEFAASLGIHLNDSNYVQFHKFWLNLPYGDERYCYNCGHIRHYKDRCSLYKEGKCNDDHIAWVSKEGDTDET